MGKWHLGNDVQKQHGLDVWTTTEDTHREALPHEGASDQPVQLPPMPAGVGLQARPGALRRCENILVGPSLRSAGFSHWQVWTVNANSLGNEA